MKALSIALIIVATLLGSAPDGLCEKPRNSEKLKKGEFKVLTLMQREFSLGHVEVHISDTNLARMDCTFGNVIFEPKKNHLTIFSEKTGKFCEVTEQDFNHKRKMFFQQQPYKWPMSEWKEVGKAEIAGKRTTAYERHCTNLPPTRSFVEECWLYRDIKTPSWLPRYLNMVMCVGTPEVPGAVLRFRRTWTDSKNRREPKEVQMKLDTLKVSQRTATTELFTRPAGLTRVKDEMEVTMGGDENPMGTPFGEQLKKFAKGKDDK